VKKSRRDVNITLAQADAHQRKHGFKPLLTGAPNEDKNAPVFVKHGEKKLRVGTRQKTRVEREFEVMLSVKKMNKQIKDYRFEGVRLQWGDGMSFKADFTVKQLDDSVTVIEVKGQHIWKHAIVRFKGCRAEWKDWFDFEFHQRTNDGLWHQLL
jgi:hypothetical protein